MQAPNITLIQNVGGTIQIDFTAANVDSPSSFTLQSRGTVSGAFVDVGSTITQLGTGSFRATVPATGASQFYRLRR